MMVSCTMPNDMTSVATRELARTRSLGGNRHLADFSRNPTTWELCLLLYLNDSLNISSAIGSLQTRCLSHSSIVRFIQERMAQGSILWRQGEKKSEKYIVLNPGLRREVEDYLHRNMLDGHRPDGRADGRPDGHAGRRPDGPADRRDNGDRTNPHSA